MRYENTEDFKKEVSDFMDLLNKDPEYTELSEDGEYSLVPIVYLEPDLNNIYKGAINIIIKEQKEMFDHISMMIDLQVFHPVYQTWQTFSGTGAIPIYNETPGDYKGTSKIMILNPLKTAIAAVYSECVKNAAKKIGRRFGKDLNRKKAETKKIVEPKSVRKIKKQVIVKKKNLKTKVEMP